MQRVSPELRWYRCWRGSVTCTVVGSGGAGFQAGVARHQPEGAGVDVGPAVDHLGAPGVVRTVDGSAHLALSQLGLPVEHAHHFVLTGAHPCRSQQRAHERILC